MKKISILCAAFALLAAAGEARAQGAPERTSAAVIADLKGDVRWASQRKGRPDLLDELYEGDKLRAEQGARVVLVYFSDCRRETIIGPATAGVGRGAGKMAGQDKAKARKTICERRKAVLPSDSGGQAQALIVAKLPAGYGGDAGISAAERDSFSGPASGGAAGGLSLAGRTGAAEARGKRESPAEPSLQASAIMSPPASAPRAELSEAKADTGRSDTAREEYKRAVQRSPKDPAPRLAYAIYLENNGELEAALAQYELILKVRPNSSSIRKHCKELKAKIGPAER